jgi:hypothetical protein
VLSRGWAVWSRETLGGAVVRAWTEAVSAAEVEGCKGAGCWVWACVQGIKYMCRFVDYDVLVANSSRHQGRQ